MGSPIKHKGYFYTIDSLVMTPEQEAELNRIFGLVVHITKAYAQADNTLHNWDDMIQIALVRVANVIISGKVTTEPKRQRNSFYSIIIRQACISQIRYGSYYKHHRTELDADPVQPSYTPTYDGIHNAQETRHILAQVPDASDRQIIEHYYGIHTGPKPLTEIAAAMAIPLWVLKHRHYKTMSTLRRRFTRNG